jgi:hypothetical protein
MKIAYGGQSWRRWISSAGFGLLLLGLILLGVTHWGQSSPIPAVKITVSSNNNVLVTVTNGTNNEFYEVYTRLSLHSNDFWSGSITGLLGQTNFVISMGPRQMSFFKAESGLDRDGDGVQNFQDADKNDTNVGILTITIQSPVNGANLQ